MIVDPEALVVAHLRATSAVTAITSRIGSRHPLEHDQPWVKVTLLDEQPAPGSPALHLTGPLVQIDCYAGSDRETAQARASLLARTVREAVHAMPAASHTGAVVTSSRAGMRRLPDTDFDPARERYVLTCDLTAHPS
jgi:hypothetical protein